MLLNAFSLVAEVVVPLVVAVAVVVVAIAVIIVIVFVCQAVSSYATLTTTLRHTHILRKTSMHIMQLPWPEEIFGFDSSRRKRSHSRRRM